MIVAKHQSHGGGWWSGDGLVITIEWWSDKGDQTMTTWSQFDDGGFEKDNNSSRAMAQQK